MTAEATRRDDPGAPPTGGRAPLVSIVTAVLNGALTLERAIESVLAQTYRPIEHIVIDGGSTDGTQAILRRYGDRLAHWESAPDRGIGDGFNRGLARSGGAFFGLLNADDWLEPDQVAIAVDALARSGGGFVFGDLAYHAPDGRLLHTIRGDPDYTRTIAQGMPDLNHPTVLARRELYETIGGFDPAWRFAMDYDWLLRAHLAGFRGVYEPRLLGHMTLDGAADRHWRRAFAEVRRIAIAHGAPAPSAWTRHVYRLLKGSGRRVLEGLLPGELHRAVRRVANPHYSPRSRG